MKWRMGGIAVALLLASCGPGGVEQAPLDLVILGGRVMDPESGLDAVRNVGIRDGKIVAVTESSLQGRETINANGLVVAPGFIDMHEHGQAPQNYEFQVRDGVTTTLELEVGTADVEGWYAARQGKTRINYGVSIGHIPVRMKVMKEAGDFTPSGDAAHRPASSEEIKEMTELMERGFREGAPAMGMGINYTEAATHEEILEMFRVAAKYKASVHVHVRYGGVKEPTSGLAAVEEVIAAAASTGAPLHVVHVTSIGLKDTPDLIALIEGAKRQGLDVTTECYPYTAGSTNLETAIFDPGWQESMGITYKDLQWVKTGERISEKTFAKFRKEGGAVLVFSIPEEVVRGAVANPMVMIASDGMRFTGPKGHPRGQGTFARVLGHYARDEKVLDLMTALRKMTIMPAQRLEKRAPMFLNKGRIRVGADADITIFDPQRVIDKATYEEPMQYSEGIPYVLVNGIVVVREQKLVENAFPGKAARAPVLQ
jgi:N-acyl-D-aspartate/D-glutamate deacylase